MGRVCTKELYRFMVDCLQAAGANPKSSAILAELLVQADRMGHTSHGLNRLEMYINDILTGACEPNNEPCVVKETASTALVDAKNVLGATASHFSMEVAICKAKKTGIGWVTVRGSNHYGMGGWWCLKAVHQGLIGMALTNTSPAMAPTRSKKVALGSNPIAMAAPAACGETFLLDMATTAVSVGKIGDHVPESVTLDGLRLDGQTTGSLWGRPMFSSGRFVADMMIPTTYSFLEKALATKCLMPLGGSELNSGFKGYGLAAMVEIFCGISSDAAYGHKIRKWGEGKAIAANLGHCFVVVDPNCFAPGFCERLYDCLKYWRKLEPTDPCRPVMAPGDREKFHAGIVDKLGFVKVLEQLLQTSEELAKKLKVVPLRYEK